jgi:hypothetical protein
MVRVHTLLTRNYQLIFVSNDTKDTTLVLDTNREALVNKSEQRKVLRIGPKHSSEA